MCMMQRIRRCSSNCISKPTKMNHVWSKNQTQKQKKPYIFWFTKACSYGDMFCFIVCLFLYIFFKILLSVECWIRCRYRCHHYRHLSTAAWGGRARAYLRIFHVKKHKWNGFRHILSSFVLWLGEAAIRAIKTKKKNKNPKKEMQSFSHC